MSKRVRTDSRRTNPRDFHPTPRAAFLPLLDALPPCQPFTEPCAGDGRLARWLVEHGHVCLGMGDIHPRASDVPLRDALSYRPLAEPITNPPFAKALLQPLLAHWVDACRLRVTLLLPLDMVANLWFAPYACRVSRLIPLGRVSWMENGTGGYENYAWVQVTPAPQPFITERKQRR